MSADEISAFGASAYGFTFYLFRKSPLAPGHHQVGKSMMADCSEQWWKCSKTRWRQHRWLVWPLLAVDCCFRVMWVISSINQVDLGSFDGMWRFKK